MAAANPSSYGSYLVDMWPRKAIQNLVLEDNVVWGVLDKKTDWRGGKYELALGYADTGGIGADFNVAQANKQPTSEAKFELTPSTFYSLFSIERQLIRRAKDEGAVVESLGRQSEGAMNAWKRANGLFLFGNGGGALGRVAAISGNTLTLNTQAATSHFEKNLHVQTAPTDGTSGTVNSGTNRITAVDVASKTLVGLSAWATAIPGIAVNDYVFIDGTFGSVVAGFDAWLPATLTSTLFFGLDRTTHAQRLGGLQTNAAGLSPRAAAKRAAMDVWKGGGKADLYVLGPEDFMNLSNDIESSGNIMRTTTPSGKLDGVTFGVAYDAIEMQGPRGKIQVVCDYNCPDGVGWMLTRKTWRLVGIGDFPYFDDFGGGRLMKESHADSYEGRIVGDYQLGCDAPGWNSRVTF